MLRIIMITSILLIQWSGIWAQKPDSRITENLKELNFKFNVKEDGTFEAKIPISNRTQIVFIHSNTSTYDKLEMREIYSVISQSNQYPNEATLLKLLQDNGQKKLGAWELIKEQNNYFIVFTAKISATLDAADLKSVIDIVATAADAMEQQLYMIDEW